MSALKAFALTVALSIALTAAAVTLFTLAQRGATGFGGTPTRTGFEQP